MKQETRDRIQETKEGQLETGDKRRETGIGFWIPTKGILSHPKVDWP